jgi:hypothetical protein
MVIPAKNKTKKRQELMPIRDRSDSIFVTQKCVMKTKMKSNQGYAVKRGLVFILVVVLYVLVKFGFS